MADTADTTPDRAATPDPATSDATTVSDAAAPAEAAPAAAPSTRTAAAPGAEASTPAAGDAGRHNGRKVREGIVASTAMDKTIVVKVVDRVRHQRYAKTVQRTKRLYAHDEANDARAGDRVRVQETRPLSKQKRWRLVEVLERAR